jgi:hypothetical protein
MDLMPGFIPAPRPQERRKASLLTSAIPGPALDGVNWRQGVYTYPESAPSYRIAQACTTALADYGDEAELGPVAARAFTIQTVTHCPRASIAEMSERADRHIRAITSQALAYELWNGAATALDPWTLPDNHVYGGLANPRQAYLTTPVDLTATRSATGGTLAAGTYYYKVSAVNGAGQTLPSSQVSVTTTGTTSSVVLTWTAVAGATGYRVYRSTVSGTFNTPALLASPTSATYTDTGTAVGVGAPLTTSTATVSGTADEGPYLNPYLEAAPILNGGTALDDPTAAIGVVEAAVAEKMAGGPIYIHVPTDFLLGMGADLREAGDLLQTPTGSIVVADAGYPGPGAAGGNNLVIYGTGPVMVWLSEPQLINRSDWVVDPATNKVALWAERDALIWFDPQTLVGINVSPA